MKYTVVRTDIADEQIRRRQGYKVLVLEKTVFYKVDEERISEKAGIYSKIVGRNKPAKYIVFIR